MNQLDDALGAFASGRPALFRNEISDVGVVALPVAHVTPELMNFMLVECRGAVYVAIEEGRLHQLGVPPQPHTESGPGNVFVPVDARAGVTTGISAEDRTRTVRALCDPSTTPEALLMPGHVTPMALHPGGVLTRLAVAESIQDVASEAGCAPGVTFCGVLTEDGHMASATGLQQFAERHDLPVVTIADVIRRRRLAEGWGLPARTLLDLPYVSATAAVRSNLTSVERATLPIAVVASCVQGHVLRSCRCTAPSDRLWAGLNDAAPWAVVAIWPAHGVPACDNPMHPRLRSALADVIAADLCAAAAVDTEVEELT